MASIELWWLYDDEHESGHNSDQVTPDGVVVAATFELLRVKVIGVGVAAALRVADVCARAPYMLGDDLWFFCHPP